MAALLGSDPHNARRSAQMRNPLNRGSSPGRARDWWLRPGSFERGHAKLGGRKKGTRNLISPAHKWAMREAAHRIGSDGNGKDGEYGYFCWVGTSDPDVFYIDILLRLLEWQEYEAAMGVKATACITNDIEGAGRSVRTKKKKPDPGACANS
jgi:hypothetical protein